MTRETRDSMGIVREFDWATIEPSVAIIEAIDDLETASQSRDGEPFSGVLGEHIDTDALDALATGASPVTVSFPFTTYTVTITGSFVHITPAESSDTPPITHSEDVDTSDR